MNSSSTKLYELLNFCLTKEITLTDLYVGTFQIKGYKNQYAGKNILDNYIIRNNKLYKIKAAGIYSFYNSIYCMLNFTDKEKSYIINLFYEIGVDSKWHTSELYQPKGHQSLLTECRNATNAFINIRFSKVAECYLTLNQLIEDKKLFEKFIKDSPDIQWCFVSGHIVKEPTGIYTLHLYTQTIVSKMFYIDYNTYEVPNDSKEQLHKCYLDYLNFRINRYNVATVIFDDEDFIKNNMRQINEISKQVRRCCILTVQPNEPYIEIVRENINNIRCNETEEVSLKIPLLYKYDFCKKVNFYCKGMKVFVIDNFTIHNDRPLPYTLQKCSYDFPI